MECCDKRMKIKIADPNPQVFGIELLAGFLIALLLKNNIIGIIGDILLFIGVGNFAYFAVSKLKTNNFIKFIVGSILTIVSLICLYALIGQV